MCHIQRKTGYILTIPHGYLDLAPLVRKNQKLVDLPPLVRKKSEIGCPPTSVADIMCEWQYNKITIVDIKKVNRVNRVNKVDKIDKVNHLNKIDKIFF